MANHLLFSFQSSSLLIYVTHSLMIHLSERSTWESAGIWSDNLQLLTMFQFAFALQTFTMGFAFWRLPCPRSKIRPMAKRKLHQKSAAAVNAIICINLSGSWRCRRKNDQAAEVAGAVIKFCETDAPTHSLFRWSQNWPSFKACWHCSEIVLILFLFAHIKRETSIVIK